MHLTRSIARPLPHPGRYTLGARVYDVVSGERPVYAAGRRAALGRLALREGDHVLDVGCGTGLNFPLLREAVGPSGTVTGLDASAEMLSVARRRIDRAGWSNVDLATGQAQRLSDLVTPPTGGYDAVTFTYVLSLLDDWTTAWKQARALTRTGGRLAVVDLSLPHGRGLLWWPLARLACLAGGADPHREPWRAAEELDDVTISTHRAGHVVTAVGVNP